MKRLSHTQGYFNDLLPQPYLKKKAKPKISIKKKKTILIQRFLQAGVRSKDKIRAWAKCGKDLVDDCVRSLEIHGDLRLVLFKEDIDLGSDMTEFIQRFYRNEENFMKPLCDLELTVEKIIGKTWPRRRIKKNYSTGRRAPGAN
jgi:hypothetical protein